MRILVAGGTGFLGSFLCDRILADDHDVICVDNLLTSSLDNIAHLDSNKRFRFVNHDITRPLPNDLAADAVFHLASPASPNHHSPISYHALPMETMMANTTGTKLLLEFCQKNNAKFLFASTSEVYGDPLVHPQTEKYNGNVTTTGPRSIYDEAKRFGETLTAYFCRDCGVDARIARIFNSYGPRMNSRDMRVSIRFIEQALTGADITIYGDGLQTRSLCYATDTVDGLYRLMMKPKTNTSIVNIGSQDEYTIMGFAQLVKELTGSASQIKISEKLPKDDPLKRRADITLAKKLLDWEPTTSLKQGLKMTIEYVKQRS